MRINIFENLSLINHVGINVLPGVGSLLIQGVYIPGSISFNNLNMIFSGSGGLSEDLSLSFGLYSLNGASLSLANSASRGTALTINQTAMSWLSFATSATQDITPGNWYFAVMSNTSLGESFSLVQNNGISFSAGEYGGGFVRGYFSVSTAALPAAIATSDLVKEGLSAAAFSRYPYILISA